MGLGQSLIALLAVVLLMTLIVNINKMIILSSTETVEGQLQMEALNYAQTVLDAIRGEVTTESDYEDLYDNYNGEEYNQAFDTGYQLYAVVVVEEFSDFKSVRVSVFSDAAKSDKLAEYETAFVDLWE